MIFFHQENIFDDLLMVVPHKIFFQSEIYIRLLKFNLELCSVLKKLLLLKCSYSKMPYFGNLIISSIDALLVSNKYFTSKSCVFPWKILYNFLKITHLVYFSKDQKFKLFLISYIQAFSWIYNGIIFSNKREKTTILVHNHCC